MIKIQEINFPADCRISNNDFYTYDPSVAFNEADSVKYLNEDLLLCFFKDDHITIDLGWYGDIPTGKGEFRLQVIKDENWDFPFKSLYSKSAEEIKDILEKILQYYTRSRGEN